MDLTSNDFGTKALYFVHLGLPAVNASDELNVLGTPATRVSIETDGSHWFAPGCVFEEVVVFGMIRTRLEQNYSCKIDFEIRREIRTLGTKILQLVDQLRTRLLSVWTRTTEQHHQLTRLMSGEKIHTPCHKHDQRSLHIDQRIIQSEK